MTLDPRRRSPASSRWRAVGRRSTPTTSTRRSSSTSPFKKLTLLLSYVHAVRDHREQRATHRGAGVLEVHARRSRSSARRDDLGVPLPLQRLLRPVGHGSCPASSPSAARTPARSTTSAASMTLGPADHPLEVDRHAHDGAADRARRDHPRAPSAAAAILYVLAACILLAAAISTYRKSALLGPVAVVLTIAYFRRRELLRLAPLGFVSLVAIHALSPGRARVDPLPAAARAGSASPRSATAPRTTTRCARTCGHT